MKNIKSLIKKILREQKEEEMNAKPVHPLKDTSTSSPKKKPGHEDDDGVKDPFKGPKRRGCTNPECENFDEFAQIDDGSCEGCPEPEIESCCIEQEEADAAYMSLFYVYMDRKNFMDNVANLFIESVTPINPDLCMNAFGNSAVVDPDCSTEIAWYMMEGSCSSSDYHSVENSQFTFLDGTVATYIGNNIGTGMAAGPSFAPIPAADNLTITTSEYDTFTGPIGDVGDVWAPSEIPDSAGEAHNGWNGSHVNFDEGGYWDSLHVQEGPFCRCMIHNCVNNYNNAIYYYYNLIKPLAFDPIREQLQVAFDEFNSYYEQGCCSTGNARVMPPSMPEIGLPSIPEPPGEQDMPQTSSPS